MAIVSLNGCRYVHDEAAMTAQAAAWTAAAAAAGIAVAAGVADWSRNRRRNLDRVGWVPWQLVSVLAFFAALGLAMLALKI
jgi:hypothetical protein